MEHEEDGDPSYNSFVRNNPKRLTKGTGRLRNQRIRGDHPNYCVVEIGQNTEKSSGDLRRLTVTQTPVERRSANAGVENPQGVLIIIIILPRQFLLYSSR